MTEQERTRHLIVLGYCLGYADALHDADGMDTEDFAQAIRMAAEDIYKLRYCPTTDKDVQQFLSVTDPCVKAKIDEALELLKV